ncbi:MAG: DUF4837 family protein [Crocinitomicaceae bacterium]|nr:DUF4837 family protein [Crocinitomicaceae bacterium]
MKASIFSVLTILTLFCSTGCDFSSEGGGISSGMKATGKVGEILVVCEPGIWNSDVKDCMDTTLTQWIMPYLPDVATFTLIHKTPSHFTQGVKRYRNTLFLEIDPTYTGEYGSIVKKNDVWADGQLVVEIRAKDFNQLLETCKLGLPEVHDEFDDMSWRRLMNNFSQYKNVHIRDAVKENFGIDLVVPSGSRIVTKQNNFYRIEIPTASRPLEFVGTGTQDAGAIFSGIMIYQYDFIDSVQLEFNHLLTARDTMLRYNVPHEIEGMYMGTQYNQFVYPEGNNVITADGKINGYEMRGMYMFTGLPQHGTGGAFWAFHFIHPTKKKVICVSGYVDAPPTTSWTHPLREIQAILRSVQIVQ